MMNRWTSDTQWPHLRALIKHDLAGVTDDDLAACGGQRDKLVDKLQEIYGIAAEEAEAAVVYYERRLASSLYAGLLNAIEPGDSCSIH